MEKIKHGIMVMIWGFLGWVAQEGLSEEVANLGGDWKDRKRSA